MGKLSFIKKPKIFAPVLIIILVMVLLVAVIRNMSEPAVGSISQTPPAEAEKTDPYAQPGSYQGKYISFQYPAHYKKLQSNLSGSYLEIINLHATDTTGKQISIAVYNSSISNDSNVAFRRHYRDIYTENDSRLGTEFTKSDGTEDTFFIQHNNLLASVSATAPGNSQAGDAYFVASTLKWK
jgi:hypothetical protein